MGSHLDNKRFFVSFKPDGGKFIAAASFEILGALDNPEAALEKAATTYGNYIEEMQLLIAEMEDQRKKRLPVLAVKMWSLGDCVFELVEELGRLGLELDGVYEHLTRDLGVKRKWLEKAIIFRRHIPDASIIPNGLRWGKCEKGTRKKAEGILRGEPPD